MIGELWRESSGVSSFFFRVLFSLLGINLATIVALLYIAYTFSTEALGMPKPVLSSKWIYYPYSLTSSTKMR